MAQKTLVLNVPPAGRASLERRLAAGSFEYREVPHALFSVKGEGVVATLYRSGKLVVQGAEPELFVARFTDLAVPAPAPLPVPSALTRIDGPLIGSDETGKGDYFGPLVVAAVRLTEGEARELAGAGIQDSKRLSDAMALRLGAAVRARVPHAIQRLDPPEYNERHARTRGGLNPLLAEMHASAIAALAGTEPGIRVVVDQFAHERVLVSALAGLDVRLEQAHRAEANVAVAAASVLARAEFLVRLKELSEEFGIALHKGAGPPVDLSGVTFVAEHGLAKLGAVAKLHFKNTGKIRAQLGA